MAGTQASLTLLFSIDQARRAMGATMNVEAPLPHCMAHGGWRLRRHCKNWSAHRPSREARHAAWKLSRKAAVLMAMQQRQRSGQASGSSTPCNAAAPHALQHAADAGRSLPPGTAPPVGHSALQAGVWARHLPAVSSAEPRQSVRKAQLLASHSCTQRLQPCMFRTPTHAGSAAPAQSAVAS